MRASLGTLAATPRRLKDMAAGLSDARLSESPGGKAWSPVEVLAHIRGCSDVWSFSILAMLAEREPQLALIHPRRWARAAGYAGRPFSDSLRTFAVNRAEFLAALGGHPDSAWGRTGDIAGRAHSVYSQVRRMAKHEAGHVEQIHSLIEAG
jgi:hypothetical protein